MIGPAERRAVQWLYTGVFLSFGVHGPFLSVWLSERGVSPGALGALFSAFPVARVLVPPLLGALADAGWGGLRLLRVTALLSLVGGGLMSFSSPGLTLPFVAALLLFATGRAPIVSLADGLAFSVMQRADPVTFGRLRRFGSFSFVVGALLCGALHDWVSASEIFPWALSGSLLFGAVTALNTRPFEMKVARATLADLRTLLSQRRFFAFLGIAFLAKIGESPFDIYLGVQLREAGAGWWLIGLAWLLAVGPELLVFTYMGPWLERRGLLSSMSLALVIAAFRWVVLGMSSSLWVLLLSQPLHAVSFAVYFVCAATYVAQSAPPALRHSGQALLGALVYGGGGAVGYWIAGLISAHFSVRTAFMLGGMVALLAASLMALLGRREALTRRIETSSQTG